MKDVFENWVPLFDLKISDISRQQLVRSIINMVKNGGKNRVYNVNMHALNIAYSCARFRNSLRSGDLIFCDGVGVRLVAAILGANLRHRNTPPDWLDELASAADSEGFSFFMVGDEKGVAVRAAGIMKERHPSLPILGTHHGFFSKYGVENEYVVGIINEAAPDILLVGMGMPGQEFWIDDNIDRLNAKVYIPVGAGFRWYGGIEKRAPRWVTDHGLEWLARLVVHPRTHFKRYVVGNPLCLFRALKWRILKEELQSVCHKPMSADCFRGCQDYHEEVEGRERNDIQGGPRRV
jgi:N-acetylglucosaminyldiphosphoundecaprenol N-acetyl-beta-D-mannosaminyltransferase